MRREYRSTMGPFIVSLNLELNTVPSCIADPVGQPDQWSHHAAALHGCRLSGSQDRNAHKSDALAVHRQVQRVHRLHRLERRRRCASRGLVQPAGAGVCRQRAVESVIEHVVVRGARRDEVLCAGLFGRGEC
jgi:hypothetical protein